MNKLSQKLSLLIATGTSAVVGLTASAQAQAIEQCFMITANGGYKDLSSLCDDATHRVPNNNSTENNQTTTSADSPIFQNQINLNYIPNTNRLYYGDRYYLPGFYSNKPSYYTYYPNVGNEPRFYRGYGRFFPYYDYFR